MLVILGFMLTLDWGAPMRSNDEIRRLTRDLLRVGGFKPTGRSKPAAEFLIKAATQGMLSSINPAVDVCNVVSLHSGLPISVVDIDRLSGPLRVGVAETGMSYVFNNAGQSIDLGGLLCLFSDGQPVANAVRDSQATKTSDETSRTLSLIWGSRQLTEQVDAAEDWYQSLLEQQGATVTRIEVAS